MKHAEQTDVTDADILLHLKDGHCGKRRQQWVFFFSVSHFLLQISFVLNLGLSFSESLQIPPNPFE